MGTRVRQHATVAVLLAITLSPANTIAKDVKADQAPGDRARAVQLWEQAIAAKGGRERLKGVRSVFKSMQMPRSFTKHWIDWNWQSLYVLPDKFWLWNDQRGTVFGLSITMFNLGRDLRYFTSTNPPPGVQKSAPSIADREELFELQWVHLMETESKKPQPVTAWAEKLGRQKVDVVRAAVDGRAIDYFLSSETHLPVQISYYSGTEYEVLYVFRLKNYEERNGIKLARTVYAKRPLYLGFAHEESRWEVNVEYDPCIFECPPRIEDGPNAWRPGNPNHRHCAPADLKRAGGAYIAVFAMCAIKGGDPSRRHRSIEPSGHGVTESLTH